MIADCLSVRVVSLPEGSFHGVSAVVSSRPYPKEPQTRVEIPFPVTLRSKDATGDRFELQGVLDSFSHSALSLRIARPLAVGSQLLACVYLSMAPEYRRTATRVAMLGTVRHSVPIGGSYWRIVIMFDRHHFLYPSINEACPEMQYGVDQHAQA